MDPQKIQTLQTQLAAFFKGTDRIFEFALECELKDRIRFTYQVILPGFKKFCFYFRFLIAQLAELIDYSPIKVFLYRLMGMKIGKGVFISPDAIIDSHFPHLIELQDYCIIGYGAKLFCHESTVTHYRLGRITVGEGSLVGGWAVIRGGTVIAKMVTVPTNAIISKDFPGKESRPKSN